MMKLKLQKFQFLIIMNVLIQFLVMPNQFLWEDQSIMVQQVIINLVSLHLHLMQLKMINFIW